jgi:hypothetical protein
MNVSAAATLLELARFDSQALSFLTGSREDGSSSFAAILGAQSAGLGADGRKLGLRDPEAAYQMMTQINGFEVSFKAQFAELSQMGGEVEEMEAVGRQLASLDTTSSNAEIRSRLEGFVAEYNEWVDRFAPTVDAGGVLDDIQAAEISLYELEQSVKNIFNGAADGVNGLGALGIAIDPVSKRATLDTARLDSVLAENKRGAVSAIDEFSANFAKSADLLNAEDNFIRHALDNRGRAIEYIAGNLAGLQAEFGTGDAARPAGQVAQALAAYERISGLA